MELGVEREAGSADVAGVPMNLRLDENDVQSTHDAANVAVPMARLDHLLARNLGCSRRIAQELVRDGAIRDAATGATLEDPRANVPEDRLPLPVLVPDRESPLPLYDQAHVMLHKPVGVVTALRDNLHPTAYALLDEAPLHDELRPVGRLDLDTSGLLLWTTEGALLQRLTHPKRAVPRTYEAALARPFAALPPQLVLEDGHRPDVRALELMEPSAAHAALARPADAQVYARITIVGGAYHEVRRIFAALGSHVLALCRTSFGRLSLPPDLPPGAFRLFTPPDVI